MGQNICDKDFQKYLGTDVDEMESIFARGQCPCTESASAGAGHELAARIFGTRPQGAGQAVGARILQGSAGKARQEVKGGTGIGCKTDDGASASEQGTWFNR